MSMTAGSVTVADDGTASGTGLAKARYDAIIATDVAIPLLVSHSRSTVDYKRWLAAFVTSLSSADVTYLQSNAKARISTSLGALQQAAGVDTTAPTATKDLPIV